MSGHLGLLHGIKSNFIVRSPSGAAFLDATLKAKNSLGLGGEAFYQTDTAFRLGVMVDLSQITIENITPMYLLTFVAMPRVKIELTDKVSLLPGVGLGAMMSSTSSYYKDSSGSIYPDNKEGTSILFAPSLAVDYRINNKYFVGVQSTYYTTSFDTYDATLYASGSKAILKVNQSLHFFVTSIQFGFYFSEPTAAIPSSSTP